MGAIKIKSITKIRQKVPFTVSGKIKQKVPPTVPGILNYAVVLILLTLFCAPAVFATATVVDLGAGHTFAVLSHAGITDIPTSIITGNIGTDGVGSSITGFSSPSTCPEVTGIVYTIDATGPACATQNATLLGTAMLNIGTAYTNANGQATDVLNAGDGAGEIGGLTLAPGVYKFTGGSINVLISTDLTLNGSSTDVWVFQIPGTFNVAANKKVVLSGGALAKNVFWVVAGQTTLITGSTLQGTILDYAGVAMQAGATLNGRAFSSTESVTLISNTITLDITSPTTNLIGCVAGWHTTDQNISFASTADGNRIVLTIDGMSQAYDGNSTIQILSTDLNHVINYYAVDNAGNIEVDRNFYCAIDKTGPIVNAGADVSTIVLPQLLNATASDATSGIATYSWAKVSGPGTVTFNPSTSEDTNVTAISLDGNYLVRLTVTDNAGNSNSDDLNFSYSTIDVTAPTIVGSPTTVGFVGANTDVIYGYDQNLRIRVIATDAGSGVDSLDVNYFDINGSSQWVRATKIDVNTYDINIGNGWAHNFTPTTLNIRVNDASGNSTVSTALVNQIILNNTSFPSGLGGATTNFNDINDFSAVSNLTFEKVGLGKIVFMSDVNLSDPAVIAQLQNLNTALTFSDGNTGNRIIHFDTSGFSGALAGIDVNVTVYGLTFATMPGLLHSGVRCDNNALACTTSYSGGTFNFISTLGFSDYEIDGNAPILVDATTAGGTSATLKVTINESATCKYTSDLTKDYNSITDVNATDANTSASWSLTGLTNSTSYTKNVWCRDLAGNDSNLLVTFSTSTVPRSIVGLGTAGNFVILAKTGVSTTGTTSVVGAIGLSPAAASYITGFGLIMDVSNTFSTSSLVTGNIYAADYTAPTPSNMSTAISDMETAYTDAAGRTLPDYTELGSGNIGGMTLSPGL